MERCKITPYEGTEPYIFVSYAHRDSGLVFPVLEELDRRGYRIWYDDGIAPGSEWPENIAQHLNNCALTMAFVSPNSIASDNCRREVTFALSKKKAFLAVILEPTTMSLGMEMQLSAQQCVMKYSYSSEEKFLGKICSCPDLAPCRKPPEKAPEPSKPEAPEPPKPEAPEPPKPAVSQPRQEQPKPAAPLLRTKEQKPRSSGKAAPAIPKKWIILGIPVVLVAAILLGMFLRQQKITDKVSVSKDETYLYLSGETLTWEHIRRINSLSKLKSLTFNRCTFQDGALSELNPGSQLTYLSLTKCTGVDSLDFLNRHTNLKTLDLRACSVSDSILPALELEKLSKLDLSGNPNFTDITKLAGCTGLNELYLYGTGISSLEGIQGTQLTVLDFCDTEVSDVTDLSDWTQLSRVCGSRSKVQDIGSLAGLPNLTWLAFEDCGITDPADTFSCLRLRKLLLGGNRLTSLDAFRNCTVLKAVDVSGNQISDVSILEKNVQTLTALDLSGNPMNQEKVAFLRDCTNLTHLYLDGVLLDNLDCLENAASLKCLTAIGCGIQDISGLAGCANLSRLRLANNAIRDISPLKDLADDYYLTLDLGGNPITDVSTLPDEKYYILCLVSESLDIRTLPALHGSNLVLNYPDGYADSTLGQRLFSTYCILDCPADQRVSLEDLLGTYRVNYLDSEQAFTDWMNEFVPDFSFPEDHPTY